MLALTPLALALILPNAPNGDHRPHHLGVPLPRCSDNTPRISNKLRCDKEDVGSNGDFRELLRMTGHDVKRFSSLCRGLKTILASSCRDLSNHTVVAGLIRMVGLTQDARGAVFYGEAYTSMHHSKEKKLGLWQEPNQMASLLIHLGTLQREIRSYLEVGCFTGWTAAVVTTYLQRVGHRVNGLLVDIDPVPSAPLVKSLLFKDIGLSFALRKDLELRDESLISHPAFAAAAASPALAVHSERAMINLCFIDGQHSYSGVKSDYAVFGRFCRRVIFHDIQEIDTLHLSNFSGGVPAFWHHLTANVARHRAAEFVMQSSTVRPVFGLGVIAPGVNGTAMPDTPFNEWEAWRGWGAPALYQHFCKHPRRLFAGICDKKDFWLGHRG